MSANGSDERSRLRTTLGGLIRRKPRNTSETTPKTTQKTNPTQTGKEKKETKTKEHKQEKKQEDKKKGKNSTWEYKPYLEEKPTPGLLLSKANLKCSMADGLAVLLSAEAFSQLYSARSCGPDIRGVLTPSASHNTDSAMGIVGR